MSGLRLLRKTLLARILQLDLRGKITAALLTGALVLSAVTTLTSYILFRRELAAHTETQLQTEVAMQQREIELRLGGVIALADSLAANTVTANALADSQGRETYLDPLLRGQNLSIPEADITVADYRGRPASSTHGSASDFGQDASFLAMMADGQPRQRVDFAGTSAARLTVVLPIRYRLTNNVEGGVILRVPLAYVLEQKSQGLLRITDAAGTHLTGDAPPAQAFEQSRTLRLPAPIDSAGLQVVLAQDRDQVFRQLDQLLLVFLGIGGLVVIAVILFARLGARLIARPLGELALAAERIATSGRPAGQLPVRSDDEFGRLSAAFNTMVARLHTSYSELENRVVERTREVEQSRREAELTGQLLREAVQSIAVGFAIYDPQDRLVMCNEAYNRIYDLGEDVVRPGVSFESIVRSGYLLGRFRQAPGSVEVWIAEKVVEHRLARGTAVQDQLADGRWLLVVEHRTPSGHLVANLIDITEQHAAEARIRDRTEQLNAIFALSPDAFISFDAKRHVKYVSPAFRGMTGLDEAQLIGLHETDFSDRLRALCSAKAPFPGLSQLHSALSDREQAHGAEPALDQRQLIVLQGDRPRILEVGLRQSDAETVSQILYFRDVTHEQEIDRMKSDFLSTAAHELRTPMASIYGFSELLLSARLTEGRRQEALGAIHRQSKLMISIVNELLDLARIDARRGQDFDFQCVELNDVIGQVCADFQPPEERAAPLHAPSARTLYVMADRLKLLQAIGNVLSNAYKYSPDGGDVSLDLVTEPADSIRLERVGIRVTDRGIGMTSEQLARVSERFYRADTSGRIPGTGLGMSIVKEIISLHGGEIQLESEFGVGTTVTLWLPAMNVPIANA